MEIKATCADNRVMVWHYDGLGNLNAILEALKENLPTWQTIEIKIENKSNASKN